MTGPGAAEPARRGRPVGLRRIGWGRPGLSMRLPLTPMIDVTFQLLLFFLLTMQFRQQEGQLPANLPRGDAGKPAANMLLDPIRIRLAPTDGGGVRIDIEGYDASIADWEQLHVALVGIREQLGSDETPVIIQPHPDVSWNAALNAFNETLRAKFKNVAWANAEPDGRGS